MIQVKNLCLAVVTVVTASFALNASASPVSLTFNEVIAGEPVTITETNPGSNTGTQRALAGAFSITGPSSLGDLIAWCLDVATTIKSSWEYQVTDNPFSNSYGLSNPEKDRVQSMFDANYGSVDINNSTQAAGFQLALWNSVYDDDSTVDSGLFTASSSSGVIMNANAYLVAAGGYTDDPEWKLTFYEGTTNSYGKRSQNLVSISPVPLPAAGFLMLGALASLSVMGYRRRVPQMK